MAKKYPITEDEYVEAVINKYIEKYGLRGPYTEERLMEILRRDKTIEFIKNQLKSDCYRYEHDEHEGIEDLYFNPEHPGFGGTCTYALSFIVSGEIDGKYI